MMMQLKCFSCMVSESKSVKVMLINPSVLQGLYEKKAIPGMRRWSETATVLESHILQTTTSEQRRIIIITKYSLHCVIK